ncbi:MAG: Rrf2 family transcriptional regulator [bacterium]|nr:Rrf2 family transcriptional regulator [bacterium]
MTLKKSTRYALYAAMEMARAGVENPVAATRVAERYKIPTSVLAKIFQQLVRAGIAVSTRGVGGGYALARSPSEVTVLDVIDAFEAARKTAGCLLVDEDDVACGEFTLCRLRSLVDEVDEMARCTYASVTLETLVGNRPRQDVKLRVIR